MSTRSAENPSLQHRSEHMSETSPTVRVSLRSPNMRGGHSGGQRGAGGGPRRGKNAKRAHSTSSGNSSGSQHSTNKPSQRWTFNPQLLGAGPLQSSDQDGQRNQSRPMLTGGAQPWAHCQEIKIKLYGIRKNCWTREVYHAMSRYGSIFRIEMEPSSCSAFVVFRPPPPKAIPRDNLRVGDGVVRSEMLPSRPAAIPSPANPQKKFCELNVLSAKRIDFGTRVADMAMLAMHTESSNGIQMMLNLKRKELEIEFSVRIDQERRKFRFRLPISLISHIYRTEDENTGQSAIVIPCESPPQFYMQKKEGEDLGGGRRYTSFSTREKSWHDWDTWHRATDVVRRAVRDALQQYPVMNHKDTSIIDIGQWTNYRLVFDRSTLAGPQFQEFNDALADHGVKIEPVSRYDIRPKTPSPLWSLLQEEIHGTHPHLDLTPGPKQLFDDLSAAKFYLGFPVRYQLEVCLSNGYLREHNITIEFLQNLAELESQNAVYLLEKVADKQQTYYDPMEIFQIPIKSGRRLIPKYCILQRSVTITPTTMHVATPIMETSNRIIRKHEADADRFIRVKFSDEKNEGHLRTLPFGKADAMFDRVLRAMKNGIVVAGRKYEFLAFGNSQFREHGAYFYAPTSSKSADDIRLSLGQFDHIKTVSKFAARLGQCFSTTRAMGVTVSLVSIPDVERNGYVFTDGVGKLSFFLAQMAAQELGLPNAFTDPPTLFQFRLGGCKGVLALDMKLNRNEVHIRPSQYKFEAPYTGLEIIRSSSMATPFFNRQIIIVLSYLGVQDAVFLRKQQEMMNDYAKAMTDDKVALQKLRKHIDMNQTTLTIASMVLDGFMESQDPFFMSLLTLWRASTIKNLKEKARIAIDDGAFVLGCVDETATLKGHMNDPQCRRSATREQKLATLPEIFLQVDDTSKKGHYIIVEGVCILARNPSLHPGDVRIVRAVNVPALHHLKNVVVLPQTGDRDVANMCSGGDLDGDDYMVLWDSEIIPEIINVPPMDYKPEKLPETNQPITAADMSEFFVKYMKHDSLGQIAHSHLAQADRNNDGVGSAVCLELAQLHSRAVDFPKSGIPAEMKRELIPRRWPHFMEKKHLTPDRVYTSRNILGRLFDEVQLVDFKPQWENPFDSRILDAFDLDEELLNKAADVKILYDEALRRLMAKHGIQTEFEAWSVFVLGHNHESRDYKFAEEFGRTIGALKHQYRNECRAAAEVKDGNDWERLGRFVAAMYTVTAHEMERALDECSQTKIVGGQEQPCRIKDPEHMPLISFPWLFPSELGKIATGGSTSYQLNRNQSQQQQKKHSRPARAGPSVGTVETEAGITKYGELLGLNFDTPALKPNEGAATSEDTKERMGTDGELGAHNTAASAS